MAKLSDEEQATLKALQEKAEAPDEPSSNGPQRVENINLTVDLNNPDQVKRAVRAGYLPASYLEDDDEDDEKSDDDEDRDEAPARRMRY